MRRLTAVFSVIFVAAAAAFTAPQDQSGRPPTGPLRRYEPRLYDVKLAVTLSTPIPRADATRRGRYNLYDAPIVCPVIYRGAYSLVHPDSLSTRLWLDGREDRGANERMRVDDGFPFHSHLAVMNVARFDNGQSLRWQLEYRTQVWSSQLNEAGAAELPWPQEFPKEVADGLKPQQFIESDHERFANIVAEKTKGKLKLVAPYLVAKELIRHSIGLVRLSGSLERHGLHERLLGLDLKGALQTLIDGRGAPADLVCVCVAVLRAAGIPARPVIGIERRRGESNRFAVWAEFYLHGAGWVPFDPIEMRGSVRNRDIYREWSGLGTLKDLNTQIPLSYHFIPPASVEVPQYPSMWGWDPRPGGDPSSDLSITLGLTSRGKGVDDPD